MAGQRAGGGARATSSPPPNSKKPAASTDAKLCAALVAYGEYHHNPYNQLIHLVCVPALLFTLLVGLAYVPLSLPAPFSAAAGGAAADAAAWWRPPLPLAAVAAYGLYYSLALNPFAGLCWTAVVGAPLWLAAVRLWSLAPAAAWRWALATHAASWFLQIVPGHALLEGRRPALVDSFWQAVLTAPLFVFLEVMFFAGWNRPLRERVRSGVEAALRRRRANERRRGAGVGVPRGKDRSSGL